jgi:hypothetical protein
MYFINWQFIRSSRSDNTTGFVTDKIRLSTVRSAKGRIMNIWVQTVYLNPLHISPFSLRASATLLYRPLSTLAILFSKPSITSSRSPRSRALFSRLSRTVYMSELSQPMAMYMSTIPWPGVYHGISRSRYYKGGRSTVTLHL